MSCIALVRAPSLEAKATTSLGEDFLPRLRPRRTNGSYQPCPRSRETPLLINACHDHRQLNSLDYGKRAPRRTRAGDFSLQQEARCGREDRRVRGRAKGTRGREDEDEDEDSDDDDDISEMTRRTAWDTARLRKLQDLTETITRAAYAWGREGR